MTIHLTRTHLVALLLAAALAGNAVLGFLAWRATTDLRATRAELTAAEHGTATLQGEKNELAEQVATCQSAGGLTLDLAGYLGDKLDELNAILLATDGAAVDFIDWCVANAVFYDVVEANRRHATWVAKQEQTNKDYAALLAEIEDFLNELDDATSTDEVPEVRHAF